MSSKNESQEVFNDEPLVKMGRGKLSLCVIILYSLFAFDFVARMGINTLFPLIQSDLGLTDSQVGILGGIVLIGLAVFALPVAYWAEKWSKKKSIAVMASVWSVGTLLFGFAKGFPVLLASRFFVGFGNAGYAPTSVSLLTSWFKKSQWGKVVGLYNTAMPFGVAVGAATCGALAAAHGWRTTLYIIGTISLVFSLLALLLPEQGQAKASGKDEKAQPKVTIKEGLPVLLKNKTLMLICVANAFVTSVSMAISTWLPMYFTRVMGLSVAKAGAVFGGIGGLGILAFPLAGFILDRWYKKDVKSRMWLPTITATLTATLYVIGFKTGILPIFYAVAIISGISATCCHIATQELVPAWLKAISYATLVVFIQAAGAIGPVIMGYLSEAIGLQSTLILMQAFFIIGSLGFYFASRSYLQDLGRSREQEKAANIGV